MTFLHVYLKAVTVAFSGYFLLELHDDFIEIRSYGDTSRCCYHEEQVL